MKVLMITSEWPSLKLPNAVPFIVRQVELLRCAGVDVDVFHFQGAKNPLRYLIAWFQLQKRLTKEQYNLVHAQWGQSAVLALPKRKPLVVTFRGDDVNGIVGTKTRETLQGIILKLVSRYSAIIADERIVVSRELATLLPKKDYHIIPSGVDLSRFQPVEKKEAQSILNLPEGDLVLFVGNPVNPVKRLFLIEEAVNLAKISIPNIRLICLGDVAHEQIPLYMNACDVLVLASIHEGSPNVVKEALACNLPVVSTDVGDVRDRIGSIDGCIVCKDDLPETIAAGLSTVLMRKKRIDSRSTVLELDENILIQNLIDVYHKALERN